MAGAMTSTSFTPCDYLIRNSHEPLVPLHRPHPPVPVKSHDFVSAHRKMHWPLRSSDPASDALELKGAGVPFVIHLHTILMIIHLH